MNKFNLKEEDIIYLENKLEGLFEKFKASANSLIQVQELINNELKNIKMDVLKLENLYAKEFGFAAENYELHERMLTIMNNIYIYDDTRFIPRRIEKEAKKYLLVELIDK